MRSGNTDIAKKGGEGFWSSFFCGFDSLKILPKHNKTRENTGISRQGGSDHAKIFCGFDIVNKSDQYPSKKLYFPPKGSRQKKTGFFLLSVKRGGGGLGQSKKSLSENTGIFLTISPKRGGGLGRVKKSLSEKTEVVKKGGGGGSQFFD